MTNKTARIKALSDLSTTIAAMKNPQCHFDLHTEDSYLLEKKLEELIKEFEMLRSANSD